MTKRVQGSARVPAWDLRPGDQIDVAGLAYQITQVVHRSEGTRDIEALRVEDTGSVRISIHENAPVRLVAMSDDQDDSDRSTCGHAVMMRGCRVCDPGPSGQAARDRAAVATPEDWAVTDVLDALEAEQAKVATATATIAVLLRGLKRRLSLLQDERAKVARVEALMNEVDNDAAKSLCRMFDGRPFPASLRTDDVRAALSGDPAPVA